jgi:hypothetical protein
MFNWTAYGCLHNAATLDKIKITTAEFITYPQQTQLLIFLIPSQIS